MLYNYDNFLKKTLDKNYNSFLFKWTFNDVSQMKKFYHCFLNPKSDFINPGGVEVPAESVQFTLHGGIRDRRQGLMLRAI